MKRSTLSVILLFAILYASTAQGDFTNGYIIKNDGSLVYGQVKYITKDFTPKECIFRWFDISEVYSFKPGDIEAFGFTYGMRYKTAVINGSETFIACLTEGAIDLLYDGNILYLEGLGLDMVLLDNSIGSVNAEGEMISFHGYRDLIEKLPDPENKFTPPPDISLKPEKMTEVIANYNRSQGSPATTFAMINTSGVFEEMRNQGAFLNHYGLLGGLNASKYTINKIYQRHGYIPEMDFFEFSPVFGLFYNRSLSRKNDRFFFQAEIIAFKTNVYIYDEYYDEYYSLSQTYRIDINMGYTGLKVPLSFKVSFLRGNFKPFLDVGVFGMLNLSTRYSREIETEDLNHVVRTDSDNSIVLNNRIIGGLAGAGFKMDINPRHSIFLELRGETGSGLYNIEDIAQQTISFSVVAGFDFH